MSTTGEYPVASDSPTAEAVAKSLPGKVFRPGALTVVVSVAVGMALAVSGLAFAQTGVKSTVDAGVRPLELRLDTVERRQLAQQDDIHEVQVDIRALYKAVMSGERQARLETLPDGGR